MSTKDSKTEQPCTLHGGIGRCFKYVYDDFEVVIIAKSKEDADKQMDKLNEDHENGYKFLGEVMYYNCI